MALALALVTRLKVSLRSESMPLSDRMEGAVYFGLEVPDLVRVEVSEGSLHQDHDLSGCCHP